MSEAISDAVLINTLGEKSKVLGDTIERTTDNLKAKLDARINEGVDYTTREYDRLVKFTARHLMTIIFQGLLADGYYIIDMKHYRKTLEAQYSPYHRVLDCDTLATILQPMIAHVNAHMKPQLFMTKRPLASDDAKRCICIGITTDDPEFNKRVQTAIAWVTRERFGISDADEISTKMKAFMKGDA